MENINKMANCGDPSFDGAMFAARIVANLNLFLSAATAVSLLYVFQNEEIKKLYSRFHLRNAFRAALLNELESKIGPSLNKVKAKSYSDHKQGFYVFAKPNLCDSKTAIKYI